MERRNYILNLGVAHLQPIFLTSFHFFLLSWFGHFFNGNEFFLGEGHAFLEGFYFGSFAGRMLFIEFLGDYGLCEFYQKEWLIFVFQEVGQNVLASEIFVEKF